MLTYAQVAYDATSTYEEAGTFHDLLVTAMAEVSEVVVHLIYFNEAAHYYVAGEFCSYPEDIALFYKAHQLLGVEGLPAWDDLLVRGQWTRHRNRYEAGFVANSEHGCTLKVSLLAHSRVMSNTAFSSGDWGAFYAAVPPLEPLLGDH